MYNSSYANQFLLLGIIKGFYLLIFLPMDNVF